MAEQQAPSISTGLFNFQNVMDQFYKWSPSDDEGRAMKNTFMANMVQAGFDQQMAKDMAYTNAFISNQQMEQAADLEMRNKLQLMNDEFSKGMTKMGAEYDYQSKFATDEANRRLNEMSHSGDLTQRQTKLEGEIDLSKMKEQGFQDRQNINTQGAVDINKISEQGDQDRANIKTQGEVDINKIGAQGVQDRLNIIGQGDQDVRKIKTQGNEDRTTLTKQQELGELDRKQQSGYARRMAGMF
jgi:hypothetical protein